LPRRLPFWLATAAGASEEVRARATGRPPLITRGAVEIFRHDWPVDTADAKRDLDLHVTRLHDGIARTIEELARSNGAT
jgi:hypothetical protein